MKNIVIFSLESIANGGDQMLGDTTEYLISNVDDVEISRAQLMPRDEQFVKNNYLKVAITHVVFSLAERLPEFLKYRLYNWGINLGIRAIINQLYQKPTK